MVIVHLAYELSNKEAGHFSNLKKVSVCDVEHEVSASMMLPDYKIV